MSLRDKNSTRFSYASISRGSDYFDNGRVEIKEFASNSVRAKVKGTGTDYNVTIAFSKSGSMLSSRCDCPQYYRTGVPCKHIYATLCAASAIEESRQVLSLDPKNPYFSELFQAEKVLSSISFYSKDVAYVCSLIRQLLSSVQSSVSKEAFQYFVQKILMAMTSVNPAFIDGAMGQHLYLDTLSLLDKASAEKFVFSTFVTAKRLDTLANLFRIIAKNPSTAMYLPEIVKKNGTLLDKINRASRVMLNYWENVFPLFSNDLLSAFIEGTPALPDWFVNYLHEEAIRRHLDDLALDIIFHYPHSVEPDIWIETFFSLKEKGDTRSLKTLGWSLLKNHSVDGELEILLGLACFPPEERKQFRESLSRDREWYEIDPSLRSYLLFQTPVPTVLEFKQNTCWIFHAFFGEELLKHPQFKASKETILVIVRNAINGLSSWEVRPFSLLFLFLKILETYGPLYPEIYHKVEEDAVRESIRGDEFSRWYYLDFLHRHPGVGNYTEF